MVFSLTREAVTILARTASSLRIDKRMIPLKSNLLRFFQRTIGEDHPQTPVVMADAGVSFRKRGMCEEAIDLFKRALEILCRTREDNVITLKVWSDLAITYLKMGLITDALELLETELELIPTVPVYTGAGAAEQMREITSGLPELGREQKAMVFEVHLNAIGRIEGDMVLNPGKVLILV